MKCFGMLTDYDYQQEEEEYDEGMDLEELLNVRWGNQHLLHIAVEIGSVELVNELLNLGARVNDRDCFGETALFKSTTNVEIANVLLEAGINPNLKNNSDEIAIMKYTASDDFVRLLAPLSDYDYALRDRDSFLHDCIWRNRSLRTIAFLLKNSTNLNVVEFGKSILIAAAQKTTNLDEIILIAKSGIDLHIQDEQGRDFYDVCFKYVQKEIRKQFPEFMEEKALRADAEKYNL